jgi:hypothetical protein
MRHSQWVFVLLLASTGCTWMKNSRVEPRNETGQYTGSLPELQAADLVGYLNRQASQLRSISYDNVRLVAIENGETRGTLEDSSLYASSPRNFRLIGAKTLLGTIMDIGSNDQEFWMYAQPLGRDNYFFCSHDAFARGEVKFPFPFDTDWVMQALGMAEYDPNAQYEITANKEKGAYILAQQAKTRSGQPVYKWTMCSAEGFVGKRPVVLKHVVADLRDPKTPIASAEIVSAKTVRMGESFVQVPTEVILDWPQQGFRMTMKLEKERINENFGERSARLFNKPSIRGSSPIDLAKYQMVVPSSYRSQAPEKRKTYRFPSINW